MSETNWKKNVQKILVLLKGETESISQGFLLLDTLIDAAIDAGKESYFDEIQWTKPKPFDEILKPLDVERCKGV